MGLFFLLCLALPYQLICKSKFGFWFNASHSLPYHVFFSKPLKNIEKGKIIAFNHPEIGLTLAKVIFGLPGDKIEIVEDQIFVGGELGGTIISISETGKKYNPLKIDMIPEGFMFVRTDHPNSFDSRYAEFGLVRKEWIIGELCPLF